MDERDGARSLRTNDIDDLVRRAHVEVGKSLVDQLRHPASTILVCALVDCLEGLFCFVLCGCREDAQRSGRV